MSNGAFLFVQDVVGAGDAKVLDQLRDLGLDQLSVAVAYHQARDVTPRSRTRLTRRVDGAYFVPPPDLFGADSLEIPRVEGLLVAEDVVRHAQDAGFEVAGWGVYCHNTTIGLAHPEVTQLSCFGGHEAPADLCPANPRVRQYATDLAVATARLGVDTVLAESLHYGSFGHGYHHERSFVPLGDVEQFLFGLCFCEHCSAAGATWGADVERARLAAAKHLDAVLAGGSLAPGPLTLDALEAICDDLMLLARTRMDVVSGLVAEVADAVAGQGSRLAFIDLSGAALGYADGLPRGPLASEIAWRFGIEPGAVAYVADYVVLAYASSVDRVAADVGAYRVEVGDSAQLRVVLRPGFPDTRDATHLGRRVAAARRAGADAVDFYHYGLVTAADLERIRSAVAD